MRIASSKYWVAPHHENNKHIQQKTWNLRILTNQPMRKPLTNAFSDDETEWASKLDNSDCSTYRCSRFQLHSSRSSAVAPRGYCRSSPMQLELRPETIATIQDQVTKSEISPWAACYVCERIWMQTTFCLKEHGVARVAKVDGTLWITTIHYARCDWLCRARWEYIDVEVCITSPAFFTWIIL